MLYSVQFHRRREIEETGREKESEGEIAGENEVNVESYETAMAFRLYDYIFKERARDNDIGRKIMFSTSVLWYNYKQRLRE